MSERLTGIDIFDTALCLAMANVPAEQLSDRVTLRGVDVTARKSEPGFDAIWLPAMLADRRSRLRQWSFPEEDAIRYQVEQGKAVFGADFQTGAARFVAGKGRHGEALRPG